MAGTGTTKILGAVLIALWIGQPSSSSAETKTGDGRSRSPLELLNLQDNAVFSEAFLDSVLAAETGRPTPERIAAWARRFLAAPGVEYRFGPADGGYVAEGRLVRDDRQDCVSLVYRCSELARSRNASEALGLALDTRFAGAPRDSVVDAAGRVDYDRIEHLDFSLDMIRSGNWGRDITTTLAGAVTDTAGSARYEPGEFQYLPTGHLAGADLREGDIAWLVLDPGHPAGRRLRDEYGLVIGHLGIVIMKQGRPWLVHAASSGLEGYYDAGRIAEVPLDVYLARVEKFSGVVVTRFP